MKEESKLQKCRGHFSRWDRLGLGLLIIGATTFSTSLNIIGMITSWVMMYTGLYLLIRE